MIARVYFLVCLLLFADVTIAQNTSASRPNTLSGNSAELRLLDKVAGKSTDVTLKMGETYRLGKLRIIMGECRYPSANPAGDAYAFLTILSSDNAKEYFRGWMISSSPALNALDHVRYDVWPLRCATS